MTGPRAFLLGLALLGLGACAPGDMVSRAPGVTIPEHPGVPAGAGAPQRQAARISDIRVRVPEDLSVSEANSFFPRADIVWQAEPPGDRRAQVAAILREAAGRVAEDGGDGRPAILEITLTRFHALSERARVTVGGTHDIRFQMRLLDADTGEAISGPEKMHVEFDAHGGLKALVALRAGQTQRVRIVDHVARALARRLPPAAPAARAGAGAPDGAG